MPQHAKRLFTLPEARDCRGTLSVVENGGEGLPFDIKRVFWIYNVPQGQQRGFHAHRTCSEMLFALQGAVDVEIETAEGTQRYHLDNPRTGLYIEPMSWCKLSGFTSDAICLCLSDEAYDENGYINDYEQWKTETAKD